MGRAMIFIAVILLGLGLLIQFSPINDMFEDIDTAYITPLTSSNVTYMASDNSTVPNYNSFDHIIMHNFAYILYGGACICVIIGLGQMRSGEG